MNGEKFVGDFGLNTVFVLTALFVSACATTPPAPPAPSETQSSVTASGAVAPIVSAEAQQQFEAALALMKTGNSQSASQQLQALASKYPEFAAPLVNLGILQLKAKRYSEAEQSLKAALQRDSQSAAAHNYLGIVYRNLGRFKDAESSYQQALTIDESYAMAHFNLGVLCDLYLQQPERALTEFERYLQLAPTPEPQVAGWVKELQRRTGGNTKNAGGAQSSELVSKDIEVKS